MDHPPDEVTERLAELEERKEDATPRLFDLLYGELRRLARRHLQSERPEHTLQATALVNEAYLRLMHTHEHWRNRAHFLGIASFAMRRVLVDHARARQAAKRPGSKQKVDLEEALVLSPNRLDEIVAVDVALKKLGHMDARQCRIVELRYFGGLTAEEAAEALGVSIITVQRDWAIAKAWLHGELSGRSPAP
jgi:RNA polymerase sigma factor (TIGR02999 family)